MLHCDRTNSLPQSVCHPSGSGIEECHQRFVALPRRIDLRVFGLVIISVGNSPTALQGGETVRDADGKLIVSLAVVHLCPDAAVVESAGEVFHGGCCRFSATF